MDRPKDSFHTISIGTTFDSARHGRDIKLFKANKTVTSNPQAQLSASASSNIYIPPPASSLSLFASAAPPQDGREDDEEPTTVSAADEGTGRPLKPMSRKRMTHLWAKHGLQVSGSDVPSPIEHFSSLVRPPLNVPQHVVNNLFTRNHRIPTPCQMQTIPSLIAKRDVLCCAPTGSGKTIAFLLPLFALLKEPNSENGIRALIVCPTMELAVQIEREIFFLMKGNRWRLVQHGQSTKGKDIFVTTPGRIDSMLKEGQVNLSQVEYLVFDEADKLWETKSDFLPIVDRVLAACTNPEKVIALFTATLSERVESNCSSVMPTDVVRVIVNGRTNANKDIEQRLLFCGSEMGKIVAMRNFIREGIKPPVLIFVQSIERTKDLLEEIQCQGLHAAVMHSKMTSEQRDEVVLQFRLGKIWVLITTELLARGIDFKTIGTVVNFDIPVTIESYVHRIGRTGRAGKKGLAVTLFTEDDKDRLAPIAKMIHDSGFPVEEWMLKLHVSKKRQRSLSTSTPHRMIVSTKKRIRVAKDRFERQCKALDRGEFDMKGQKEGKAKKTKKNVNESSDDDDDE